MQRAKKGRGISISLSPFRPLSLKRPTRGLPTPYWKTPSKKYCFLLLKFFKEKEAVSYFCGDGVQRQGAIAPSSGRFRVGFQRAGNRNPALWSLFSPFLSIQKGGRQRHSGLCNSEIMYNTLTFPDDSFDRGTWPRRCRRSEYSPGHSADPEAGRTTPSPAGQRRSPGCSRKQRSPWPGRTGRRR